MTSFDQLSAFVATGIDATDQKNMMQVTSAVYDVFGCILNGANRQVARTARRGLMLAGPGVAPVYGSGETLAPLCACIANAIAAHASDFDDWEEPGNTHPSAVMVPALLAAAHLAPVSGARFAASYATGFEVIARFGEAFTIDHYWRGFHSTATLGALGAAAAVAHLRGLDAAGCGHALSLAASQASGYTAQIGSDAKPAQAGFAAKAGLVAALMAETGTTGKRDAVNGARGMAGLMAQHSVDAFAAAMARLGQPPALIQYGIAMKPWPTCSYIHRLMTAALEIRQCKGFDAAAVSTVNATMPDVHHAILTKGAPQTRSEAMFSAESCLAQILLTGNIMLNDLDGEFWHRPDISKLAGKVTVSAEPLRRPDLNFDPEQPDTLEVHLLTGEQLKASCAYPRGALQSPMSDDQLAAKFRQNTGLSDTELAVFQAWVSCDDVAGHLRPWEGVAMVR